ARLRPAPPGRRRCRAPYRPVYDAASPPLRVRHRCRPPDPARRPLVGRQRAAGVDTPGREWPSTGRMVNNFRLPVQNRFPVMMSIGRRMWSAGAVAVLGSGVLIGASQAPEPQAPADQSSVTFKVEINYVEVDAAIVDRQGQFVPGLKKEDFE